MNTRGPWCPTPSKQVFLTAEAAQRAARRLPVSYRPNSYYRCPCGRWHLTTGHGRPA